MKLNKKFIAMFREEAKKAQWEINCWNGKSIDDLVVDYLERKELKPEDFTGMVVLTIKEAKEILQSSYDVMSWAKLGPTHIDNALNVQELLKHRIELVEKSHGQK